MTCGRGEEILKTVFQSVADKVIVVDKAGNVVDFNEPKSVSSQGSPQAILKVSAGESYFEVCRRQAATGDDAADAVLLGDSGRPGRIGRSFLDGISRRPDEGRAPLHRGGDPVAARPRRRHRVP